MSCEPRCAHTPGRRHRHGRGLHYRPGLLRLVPGDLLGLPRPERIAAPALVPPRLRSCARAHDLAADLSTRAMACSRCRSVPAPGLIKKALFASTNPAQARLPPDEVTSCTEGSQQGTESAGIMLRQIVLNDPQDCADFVYIGTARPFPARVGSVPSPVMGIAQVDTPVAQGLLGLARPQAGVLKLGQHRPAARGQTGEL
jgi:hypothetical protein